jgi:ubiquinone/menaquinone biosynthesis C-methylase UbiE
LLARKCGYPKQVLDAGCGNARNSVELQKIFPEAEVTGIDSSNEMLENARKRFSGKLVLGKIEELPFPENSFDAVFCLAVFHHLESVEERRKALSEFSRVLSPGGFLLLSVWQKKGFSGNSIVPWKRKSGEVIERFYHFFGRRELQELLSEAGFSVVSPFFEGKGVENSFEGANLCFVAKALKA